jgi:hypothetical protein
LNVARLVLGIGTDRDLARDASLSALYSDVDRSAWHRELYIRLVPALVRRRADKVLEAFVLAPAAAGNIRVGRLRRRAPRRAPASLRILNHALYAECIRDALDERLSNWDGTA